MGFKLSNRSKSRLKGIKPVLIDILEKGITDSPYDFGIPQLGGYRTAEDQNSLYQKGRSKPGKKITFRDGYKKKSYHQTGNAFDIFIYINGKASWDKDMLEAVAKHLQKIAKDDYSIDLIWGGDWDNDGNRVDHDPDETFFDGAHFQI